MKNVTGVVLTLLVIIAAVVACSGSDPAAAPPPPAAPVEAEAATVAEAAPIAQTKPEVAVQPDAMAEPPAAIEAETLAETVVAPALLPEPAPTAEVTTADTAADAGQVEPAKEAEAAPEIKADTPDMAAAQAGTPFNATIGLDTFDTYRLNFEANFDGTNDGQPTSGILGGLFEETKSPEAQHWLVSMTGDAFSQMALLGGKMEIYDMGATVYLQNPGDDSWIGVPAMFVDSMLPAQMAKPEEVIRLPQTATLQSGQETVNDVLTQRYTFTGADFVSDKMKDVEVNGTIWVAVDGNYVVRYEATATGKFSDMQSGGMKLLDEGTVVTSYDVTDVNADVTIQPPAGAKAIDLTKLLFN